ncbi:O-antigen ligase family protein [Belnapia sp. T6]|uniref:O-antigen ligase family protein n=1 Tax=Belnapia mucosa TaxID=2804532 RepID=A0ABS1V2L1_9PROT|nr:O-antigen ligase family protein [Belnapia mucosa]MBL6455942.1 O-antigen ligase family protein [Belnapia mucosa]
MTNLTSPLAQVLIALLGAVGMLLFALWQPNYLLLSLPLLVGTLGALAMYQYPPAMVALLIVTYGVGLDIQLDGGMLSGSGGATATLGAALVKVVPFALAGLLAIRYGISDAVNWPFLAYTIIATLSIVILPIGRIVSNAEMIRSFVGSTAPFVLAFALAPRRTWTLIIRGTAFVPLISAGVSLLTTVAGLYPAFDTLGRFQGMHTAPFLAGFCSTAIFAATTEYLRGFRLTWLIIGALDLAVLLATQARAPLGAVIIFVLAVFLLSDRKTFPLKRKVDLAMGGGVLGMLVLSPVIAFALQRFMNQGADTSGRDLMWPYFIDAIQARPLFGYGLGAGKLLVNPDDPLIKLLGSTAAHNEYLRLSVDGGIFGCALIFISLILWVWVGTRRIAPGERLILRAGLVGWLVHSGFDNTLIATTSVIMFVFFAAVLARARVEAKMVPQASAERGRHHHRHRRAVGVG